MYDFIDVSEQQPIESLPAEALQVNGMWLDEVVPGYRTLSVSGRESISTEITELEQLTGDGNRYQYKRYKPRTIIVTYQLIARDSIEFRAAFNKLNALLDAEEMHLVFADEDDKYFIGTKRTLGDIPPGTNKVVADMEFYCADPFKYSLEEKSITLSSGDSVFNINYEGTHAAYPTIEAHINSYDRFISYLHDNESILLIGKDEAIDEEPYQGPTDILIDDPFYELDGWDENIANLIFSSEFIQVGNVGITEGRPVSGAWPMLYGTGTAWHGPSITKRLPANSSGHVGMKAFGAYWEPYFVCSAVNQYGAMQIAVTGYNSDGEKVNIASVMYYKFSKSSNTANVRMIVHGQIVNNFTYVCNNGNSVSGVGCGWASIERNQDNGVIFHVGGRNFDVKSIIPQDIEAREVSVAFGAYGDENIVPMAISHMRVTTIPKEMYTPMSAGDIVIADCSNGEITVNGTSIPGMGALGNDWETFYLSPGNNQIQCVHSSVISQAPTYTLKYREVYL